MGHFKITYLISYMIIWPWEATTITTRLDHRHLDFRRHTNPPPFTNWELGLRESVHQALSREHHTDPDLREQLLEAPFVGRQNIPTPFGDIAVLARGQLYVTPEGFKFIQDSNEDECNDCYHKAKCVKSSQCHLWETLSHHHKLLALWTVKRIRHRDPHYGYVFEIEYTISPITSAINEELVRRHGYFNYNVPGHIFIIKSNPEANAGYYLNSNGDKWYKNQATQYPIDQKHDFREHGSGQFKHGIVIGVSPDGYKHVLHSYPGFYSSYHPQNNYNDQTTIDPKEYELYKKLIESLASKTSKVPHRFSVTTTTKKATSTTEPVYKISTFVPEPQTTYVQYSDGHLLPLTEKTVQPSTTQLVTTAKFPLKKETSQTTKYSEPDLFYHTLQTPTEVPTLQPARPIAMPMTTIHYFTPDEVNETSTASSKIPAATSVLTTKPTTQEIHIYDIFSPIQTPTERFTPRKTTKQMKTQPEQRDVITIITSTEPMSPITERPGKTSPISINEQLPPPSKSAEMTEPYIFTVTTEASVLKKESTFTKPLKEKITTVPVQMSSTFIPTTKKEVTTFIERIPYTEQKTTVILPVPTTQKDSSTTTLRYQQGSTSDMFTTTTEAQISAKTSTDIGSTLLENLSTINQEITPAITIFAEINPSTHFIQTTQQSSPNTKSPTIFEYNSTSKSDFEITQTTVNTTPRPSYYPTISNTLTFTNPTTTTHYFNTFGFNVSESTVFTTERPTLDWIGEVTSTTPNVIGETSYKGKHDTTTSSTENTITGIEVHQNISTTMSDFLKDENNKYKKNLTDKKKDYGPDDIFGTLPTKVSVEVPQTTTKRPVTQSDVAQALFGGRRSKQIKVTSKIKRKHVTRRPKIIYNNFYTPSTPSSTSATTINNFIPNTSTTTEYWLSTDQSFSTSISFKVNKKKHIKPTTLQLKSSVKENSNEMYANNKSIITFRAERPESKENSKSETKKVLDDFALKLVNHARTIDLMNSKTSKEPNHRRSFSVRKRSQRRSNNNTNKNNKKTESE